MGKIVIFIVVLSLTLNLLTASPTPARAHHWHHWHYWHHWHHWGSFYPPSYFYPPAYAYPPRYYYPPAYAYPPRYYYPPTYGYDRGYRDEGNNGDEYQGEGNYDNGYQR